MSILRNRWAPILILAPLLILSGLVAILWPAAAEIDVAGARARDLFALISYVTLGCILVLVPAFPATSLVRERRQGTLALLLGTPISGSWIYVGKLLGQLSCILILLMMGLPAVSACYAMGGINLASDVVVVESILVLAIVQYVALSLWVSCFASTPSGALRAVYGLVVVFSVISLGPSLFAPTNTSGVFAMVAEWLRCLSPITPILEQMGHSVREGHGGSFLSPTVVQFAILAIVSTIIFTLHTAASIRPTMFDRSRASGNITQDRSLAIQRFRRLLFLVDPQRRAGAMPDWINPVLIKEFRSRRFGRANWLTRLVALCSVMSLALTYVATSGSIAWSPETIGGIMVLLQTALIVMFVPSLASGLISDESESGGWTLLRMTPLTPGKIVRGKLTSVGCTVLLILLATLPGYAMMVLIKPVLRQQVISVLLTLVLMAMLTTCVSSALSGFFRRSAPATITAYLALVLMLAGPMLFWLGRDAPFGHQLVERFLVFSPVAAALSLIEVPGFADYRLVPIAWWVLAVFIMTSLAITLWKTHQLMRPE